MNCFQPSWHRSAKRVKRIDVSSRNRRNRRRFAHARYPTSRHVSLPPTLDGHTVGTWWSLLAAALHRTISLLAIRQIVDRARTPKRHVGSCLHPRSLVFSFLHLYLIFVFVLFLSLPILAVPPSVR